MINEYAAAGSALQKAMQTLTEFYESKMKSAALLQSQQAPKPDEPFDGAEAREQQRTGSAESIINLLEVAAEDYSKLESETKAGEELAQKEYEAYMHSYEVEKAAQTKEME